MQIKSKPFGEYQTNCYICDFGDKSLIIDPGIDATEWVMENAKNPIAILNTHGHFDHVWSNTELKSLLKIPLICPSEDAFMLKDDIFNLGMPESVPDILAGSNEELELSGVKFRFWHFPGHTPGCSMIEVEGVLFSGDFIFKNSIGRYDFPYSSAERMRASLERFMRFDRDLPIYPGHGRSTSVFAEQKVVPVWIEQF